MPAPTEPNVRDAAVRLAAHLREHPEAALQPSSELAEEFDLPPDFVQDVLRGIGVRPKTKRASGRPVVRERCREISNAVARAFCCITRRPMVFVGVTALLAVLGVGAALLLGLRTDAQVAGGSIRLDGLFAIPFVAVMVLHTLCYYRHAMTRLPLMGALLTWMIMAPVAMIGLHDTFQKEPNTDPLILHLSLALALFMVSALYAAIGVGAALVGGYVRIRREDRIQESLSRQELLERFFELQEKLGANDHVDPPGAVRAWEWWSAQLKSQPWAWVAALALSLSLFNVLTIGPLAGMIDQRRMTVLPLFIAVQMTSFALTSAVMFMIAFFSRRFALAAPRTILFSALGYIPLMIPIGPFGLANTGYWLNEGTVLVSLTYALVIAGAGVVGAMVEERAHWNLRVLRSDPAAVAAEMVRLQWKLAPRTKRVCVMVVDVVRSSEMKAQSDPLEVEYSFREYQSMLARIILEGNGSVHSTAGDGMVAAFSTCREALAAAKKVQSEIDGFNREANRLETPFRLRIGLHNGLVAGDLEKVEFTEVIDIAAHVQAKAPVGGIAVTGPVADEIEGEPLAEMKEPVDGHPVLFVLNPTA